MDTGEFQPCRAPSFDPSNGASERGVQARHSQTPSPRNSPRTRRKPPPRPTPQAARGARTPHNSRAQSDATRAQADTAAVPARRPIRRGDTLGLRQPTSCGATRTAPIPRQARTFDKLRPPSIDLTKTNGPPTSSPRRAFTSERFHLRRLPPSRARRHELSGWAARTRFRRPRPHVSACPAGTSPAKAGRMSTSSLGTSTGTGHRPTATIGRPSPEPPPTSERLDIRVRQATTRARPTAPRTHARLVGCRVRLATAACRHPTADWYCDRPCNAHRRDRRPHKLRGTPSKA